MTVSLLTYTLHINDAWVEYRPSMSYDEKSRALYDLLGQKPTFLQIKNRSDDGHRIHLYFIMDVRCSGHFVDCDTLHVPVVVNAQIESLDLICTQYERRRTE